MIVYLLERATSRWQVWLILSPGYLIFAAGAVFTLSIALHQISLGHTVDGTIGVLISMGAAAISVYFLSIVVGRAKAMFPNSGEDQERARSR